MTTQEKIAQIQKDRYNDYAGNKLKALGLYHADIRKEKGDEYFLEWLEGLQALNPKPVYIAPLELSDTTKIVLKEIQEDQHRFQQYINDTVGIRKEYNIGLDPFDVVKGANSNAAFIAIKKTRGVNGLVTVKMRPYRQFKWVWLQRLYKWYVRIRFTYFN